MKKRTKIIGLAIAAFCAFSAYAATAQAADQWFVGTKAPLTTLAVGQSRAVKGKSGASRLTVPGLGVSIQATADSFTGKITNVATPTTVEAHIGITSGVKFTGAVVKTHPGLAATTCTVNSVGQPAGTILTTPLTGKFLTNTEKAPKTAHVLLKPATGTVFTEIEINGASCAFNTGGVPLEVTGNVEGAVISPMEANTPSHSTTVEFPETALVGSTLKLGAFSSQYIGNEEVELETAGELASLE
jgi:hypothetical protein